MKLSTAIIAGVALLGAATTASVASAAVITVSEAYDYYNVYGGSDQVVFQINTPIALTDLKVSGQDFGPVAAGAYNFVGGDPDEGGGPIYADVFISTASHTATGYFGDVYGDADYQIPLQQVGTLSIGGVPEPAAWGLMLVGFGGIGAAMRSSRKVAAAT
jgi:hypothetical protein